MLMVAMVSALSLASAVYTEPALGACVVVL